MGIALRTRAVVATALLLAGLRPAFANPPEPEPAAGAAAAAVILDSLVVRVYDNTGVIPTERSRAIAWADRILDRADVDVEWIDCPSRKRSKSSATCDAAPARGELVIRLVNAPITDSYGTRRQALGYSLIDTTTGVGTMATVYVDRVTQLASAARMDRSTILGRAMAHEIGHLILASNAHAESGLMRETWTAQQLVGGKPEDWLFLPSQSEQLRQARQLQRNGGSNAALPGRIPTNGG